LKPMCNGLEILFFPGPYQVGFRGGERDSKGCVCGKQCALSYLWMFVPDFLRIFRKYVSLVALRLRFCFVFVLWRNSQGCRKVMFLGVECRSRRGFYLLFENVFSSLFLLQFALLWRSSRANERTREISKCMGSSRNPRRFAFASSLFLDIRPLFFSDCFESKCFMSYDSSSFLKK
jgi:hypothetical protein